MSFFVSCLTKSMFTQTWATNPLSLASRRTTPLTSKAVLLSLPLTTLASQATPCDWSHLCDHLPRMSFSFTPSCKSLKSLHGLNQLFFRYFSVQITGIVAQLLSFPLGRAQPKFIPNVRSSASRITIMTSVAATKTYDTGIVTGHQVLQGSAPL